MLPKSCGRKICRRGSLHVERQISVIMLAGGLKPPPLREALNLPPQALPVAPGVPVLVRWLEVTTALRAVKDLRVVVSSDEDAVLLTALAARIGDQSPRCRVMLEPGSWRGTAGLLHDVAKETDETELILLVESSVLPPRSLHPLFEEVDELAAGVIGASRDNGPNGVALFKREVLEHIPAVGYFDLKEQLLPRLHKRGLRVRPAYFDEPVLRLHDRQRYLRAVATTAQRTGEPIMIHPDASVDEDARLAGTCLIDAGAVVEAGAIVHESVVMEGAIVRCGAAVSRSVAGPGAVISGSQRSAREVVAASRDRSERRALA